MTSIDATTLRRAPTSPAPSTTSTSPSTPSSTSSPSSTRDAYVPGQRATRPLPNGVPVQPRGGDANPYAPTDDDDVIKVDSYYVESPKQKLEKLQKQVTPDDARAALAESQQGLRQFRPALLPKFALFCAQYGLKQDQDAMRQFATFAQQSVRGKNVDDSAKASFFSEARAGKITENTVGTRSVLDPRVALTDPERAALKDIALPDGENALAAREAAEQLWASEKRLHTTVDVVGAYASPEPHRSAFQQAARQAGYAEQEIEMAAGSLDAKELWQSLSGIPTAMPSTFAEFKARFGDATTQSYRLDCNRLEDARAAIAEGKSLGQFYTSRVPEAFEASPVGALPRPSELADPREIDWTRPPAAVGTAVNGQLGLLSGTYYEINGRKFFAAGVNTAFGAGGDVQAIAIYPRPGEKWEDVVKGLSYGVSGGFKGVVAGGVSGNASGYIVSAGATLVNKPLPTPSFQIPVGVSMTDTVEIGDGRLPFISSTGDNVAKVISYSGSPLFPYDSFRRSPAQLAKDVGLWPKDRSNQGRGLYEYATGNDVTQFVRQLPEGRTPSAGLQQRWLDSPERKEILAMVDREGGTRALDRTQRWSELTPRMKEQMLKFLANDVKNWMPPGR